MINVGLDEIDAFVSNLENNDLLLIAGNGYISVSKLSEQLMINSVNCGKRVAYFSSENDLGYADYLKKTYDIKHPENITVFVAGSHKEDDIEIPNNYSVAKIRLTLDKQLKKGIRYDLIIIESIDKTYDFIYDKQYMYSICKYVRDQFRDYGVSVAMTTYYLEEVYESYESDDLEDRLFYDVRDVVDFLMVVDERYEDDDSEETGTPYQFDIKLLDCRIREMNMSLFYNISENRMCRKEGKALELFKTAKALGLGETDASSYATYWMDHEDDCDDEFAKMRFSQDDEDESEMKCLLQEEMLEYKNTNRRTD